MEISQRGGQLTDFVVERGQRDGWYYAIWKSGWKECSKKWSGSNNTMDRVALPITFSNTNYIISMQVTNNKEGNGGFSGNWTGVYAYSKSVISIDKQNHGYPYFIRCEGY